MAEQRQQMEEASALIRARRYDEARAILMGLSHPQARQWLAQLDRLSPPPPAPEPEPVVPAEESVIEPGAEQPPQDRAAKIRQRMEVAREMIHIQRYDDARAILEDIPHPKAREWLAQIDQLEHKTSAPAAPPEAAPRAKSSGARPSKPAAKRQSRPPAESARKGGSPAVILAAVVMMLLGAVAALILAIIQFLISIEVMRSDQGLDLLVNAGFAISAVVAAMQAYWTLLIWDRKPGMAQAVTRLMLGWGGAALVINVLLLVYVATASKFDAIQYADNPLLLAGALGGWLICNLIAILALDASAPGKMGYADDAVPPFMTAGGKIISPALKPYDGESLLDHAAVRLETADRLNKAVPVDVLLTSARLVLWQSSRRDALQPSTVFERLVRRLDLARFEWTPDGVGLPSDLAHRVAPGGVAIPYRAVLDAAAQHNQVTLTFRNRRGKPESLILTWGDASPDRFVTLLDSARRGDIPRPA